MKADGSTCESGACSVGLSHAGCACAHEVEPRADERIAMDCVAANQNLVGRCMTRTPQSYRKAQSVLDSAEEALGTARERCDTAWTTDAEISAKLCCVLEKAASDFNRHQHVPTVVSTEVDESKQVLQERHEGSQLHRGSCRAAGGRSLVKSG